MICIIAITAHIPCQESSASELDEVVIKVKTGYVLLVHNYIFPSRTNVARLGSEKDVKNLKSLFDDFGFRGSGVHENLTADELMKVLQDTSEKDFLKYDCFFCVIMSHGSQDGIFGVDDKVVHVDAITSMFRRNECPSLEGKPKVFLIQACRGIQQDMVPVEADSDVTSMPYPMLPSDADFLICFSSAPGYQSYRQRELGSWFLSTVVKVFRKYAHSEHLMDMMLRVNNEVAQYSSPSGHKQMPCEVCMLTKKVFFETKYLV